MKTDVSITYKIKGTIKQKETYVLFAVTLFFRKKSSLFCFLSYVKSM